uniref:Methenyltetrahydrofolate synthetase domain containing n=1 Tax=Mus musculus TaxID=10090 RepID=A0A1D5RMJ5_MOUSE
MGKPRLGRRGCSRGPHAWGRTRLGLVSPNKAYVNGFGTTWNPMI